MRSPFWWLLIPLSLLVQQRAGLDTGKFIFATVQIAESPRYASILVYRAPDATQNVIVSSAHTKPAEAPEP